MMIRVLVLMDFPFLISSLWNFLDANRSHLHETEHFLPGGETAS
jgi:hypothetical protein